jgi:hypothetical protein
VKSHTARRLEIVATGLEGLARDVPLHLADRIIALAHVTHAVAAQVDQPRTLAQVNKDREHMGLPIMSGPLRDGE